jgi:pimeloyl-ACP methyl ester carboxylesterase
MPVDRYRVVVDECASADNGSISCTTVSDGVIETLNDDETQITYEGETDHTYRFTVLAVKDNTPYPLWPEPVFARPGQFSVTQPPDRPANPILFLHGICPFSAPTDASSWDAAKNFMISTLNWKFGGTLSYRKSSQPDVDDPELQGAPSFLADGDFFTSTFGDCKANYPDRRGLSHQADEVRGFIRALAGVQKVSVFAHSMGGISARKYLTDWPDEAQQRVASYTTYGSPHWGASFTSIGQLVSDGAADLEYDCGFSEIKYGPFMEQLRKKQLPDGLRYFAIRGRMWLPRLTLGCLSDRWDGIIPVDSADFGSMPAKAPLGQQPLTAGPVQLLETGRYHWQQTNDIGAILCGISNRCMTVTLRSPVTMQVVDPEQRRIRSNLMEIPGASYDEIADGDGHVTTRVIVPFPIAGDYRIILQPKAGASPTAVYSLEVVQGQTTRVLASNEPLSALPPLGFDITDPPDNRDVSAPVVTAPPAISVMAVTAAGVTGGDSSIVASFLVGGSAQDLVDLNPQRLAAQVAGVNVDDRTVFPIGRTSVTFRFRDASGNIGTATSQVIVTPAGAADVSGLVKVARSGLLQNRTTGRFTQTVTVTNMGPAPISGPVSLVVDALSANATVYAPAGVTSCAAPIGSSYLTVDVGADGILSPGEIGRVVLEFVNPTKQAIAYATRVLAGPGAR